MLNRLFKHANVIDSKRTVEKNHFGIFLIILFLYYIDLLSFSIVYDGEYVIPTLVVRKSFDYEQGLDDGTDVITLKTSLIASTKTASAFRGRGFNLEMYSNSIHHDLHCSSYDPLSFELLFPLVWMWTMLWAIPRGASSRELSLTHLLLCSCLAFELSNPVFHDIVHVLLEIH
ncbi:hypothetical protein Tco_1392170 [Tanacetum coccineum]